MSRLHYRLISLFLLFIILSEPALVPVHAKPNQAITQGVWKGVFTRRLRSENNSIPGLSVVATSFTTGEITILVSGDEITGSFGEIKTHFAYAYNGGGSSKTGTCEIFADYNLNSGSVKHDEGGLPTLYIYYNGTTTGKGDDFCKMMEHSYGGMILRADEYDGEHMSGDSIEWTDQDIDSAISNMRKGGADVEIEETWEFSSKSPVVTGISPGYVTYFLQDIPFENIFTASVDWKGSEPGHVDFTLAGVTKSDATGVGIAQQPFTIGPQPVGKNPLSVVAVTSDGYDSEELLHDVILVEQPGWAENSNLAPFPQGTHILYKGKTEFPEDPLEVSVQIPDYIPFIGGKWGILPTQLVANITATSLGGQKQDDITGKGGIGLGNRQYTLKMDGKTNTNMTENELDFLESVAHFKVDPPVYYKHTVGLLDILPGASAAFDIPVIGDALEALNSAASITGDVSLKVSGDGTLDDDSNHETLIFTKGHIRTDAAVSVFLRIDPKFAYAQITGKGFGFVVYQIAPEVKPTDCSVNLGFMMEAGMAQFLMEWFDISPWVYSKDWNVYSCTGSANKTSSSLAVTIPKKTPVDPRIYIPIENDQVQVTTLVNEADGQAGPALALAPDGKMAFAWMAVDPAEHVSEIRLRVFDGEQWSDDIILNSGGKINFAPSAGFDKNGKIVVVWPQLKSLTLDELDDDFVSKIDIVYSVFDPKKGKEVSQGVLTDDKIMDFSPRIVTGNDGNLWALWQSSPSASVTARAEMPNSLLTANWNGKAWSDVKIAADNLVGNLYWSAASGNNELIAAYDIDTNGNLSDAEDREIFVVSSNAFGSPEQLTHNQTLDMAPLITFSPDNTPTLAWLNGNQVVSLQGDLEGEPSLWFDETEEIGLLLSRGILLAGNAGEMGLLLPGDSEAGLDTWLYLFDTAANTWKRQELPLFGTQEVEYDLTAALKSNGEIMIGLASSQLKEQDGMPALADVAELKVAKVSGAFNPIEEPSDKGQLSNFPSKAITTVVILLCGITFVLLLAVGAFIMVRKSRKKK